MDKILTIAIPTYNRANCLDRLLNSLSNEDKSLFDILISDNASIDNTREIVDKYKKLGLPITYNCNRANIGANNNFNKCYEMVKSRYIWLIGDDDVVCRGAITEIVNFITKNLDVSLIFLNHSHFRNGNPESNQKPFLDLSGNITTDEKTVFIKYAGIQLSFMSSFVLDRSKADSAVDFHEFDNNHFSHTCIAFKTTSDKSKFGIIGKVCIKQDLTKRADKPRRFPFSIFGRELYNSYCILGPNCGYDYNTMLNTYYTFVKRQWPKSISYMKANGLNFKNDYRENGLPFIKDNRKLNLYISLFVYCPNFIFAFSYKIYKLIYQHK